MADVVDDGMVEVGEDGLAKLTEKQRQRALAICLRRKVKNVPQLASAILFAMGEVVEGTLDVQRGLLLVKMANVALKAVELQERYGPGRADKGVPLREEEV